MRALRVSVLTFVVCGGVAAGVLAAIIPNEGATQLVIKACVAGALAALFAHARASGSAQVEHATFSESAVATIAGAAPAALVVAAALLVAFAVIGYHPLWATREVSLADAARSGDIAEVFRLVRAGADPNPALEAGVESRQVEVLEVLVRAGATADDSRRQRLACLSVAIAAPEVSAYLRSNLPPASEPECPR